MEQHDVERRDGVTRQLQCDDDNMASVDASPDVVTFNWTTTSSPTDFLHAVLSLAGETTADVSHADVTIGFGDRLIETRFQTLRTLARYLPFVVGRCSLLRLDLSATRSVAWQRLDSQGHVVAGLGDSTANLAHGTDDFIDLLVTNTATKMVDPYLVTKSVVELAGRWENRANAW